LTREKTAATGRSHLNRKPYQRPPQQGEAI